MIKVNLEGKAISIDPTAFVAQTAQIIGEVSIQAQASVWYQSVLRADVAPISIGQRSNIQDGCIIHASYKKSQTIVEDDVTVGHGVILHGCTIKSNSLIGMDSVIMDNAVIPSNCIVGAGSLVTEGKTFDEGSLIMGRPAKVVRKLNEEEIKYLKASAEHYVKITSWYKQGD